MLPFFLAAPRVILAWFALAMLPPCFAPARSLDGWVDQ